MSSPAHTADLRFGPYRPRLAPWSGLGLIIEGLEPDAGAPAAPADYTNEVLLTPEHREQFFTLVDGAGLVVCKGVGGDDAAHRDVRGRSTRGRLSQGEFYHHDGCSGPVKPRVVEIRCPYQLVERYTSTAVAPFPEVLFAMLHELRPDLRTGELARAHATLVADGALTGADLDGVQGLINRKVRGALDAEEARAWFRGVDLRAGAYRAPWEMGESRFIANSNPGRTMQHRRAYLEVHSGGRPNGRLVKRWPADPHLEHD